MFVHLNEQNTKTGFSANIQEYLTAELIEKQDKPVM